jgi:UDP-N-acetylmuramate--alanine ligase
VTMNMTGTDSPQPLPPGARVHLVGVGGAGMSALATVLLERGHRVSGSDLRGGRAASALAAMGAEVHVGHDAANVEGADVVAVSTAVPPSNPERVRASALGVPVLTRAELLARLLAGYRGVLVAGTHGKTTTTSMVTVSLQAAGLDPSFAIGGTLHDSGTSAHHGTGDLFIAEADESDGSFVAYVPACAVVTNVELDHHDHYADLAAVEAAFDAFLARRAPGAPAICCLDDPGSAALAARSAAPVLTYGEGAGADLHLTDVVLQADGSTFTVDDRTGSGGGEDLGRFHLRVPGRHNVLNAGAAIAVARWAGAGMDAVRAELSAFAGAARRFQRLGEAAGVTVVDDYAHHPTELAAVLQAARQAAPRGRVVVAFQPHRYSRTAALGPQLGVVLAGADVALVGDVYAAGEPPVPGVTGAVVADAAVAAGGRAEFIGSAGELTERLLAVLRAGDLLLTLGAGDITELGPVVLQRLEERRA